MQQLPRKIDVLFFIIQLLMCCNRWLFPLFLPDIFVPISNALLEAILWVSVNWKCMLHYSLWTPCLPMLVVCGSSAVCGLIEVISKQLELSSREPDERKTSELLVLFSSIYLKPQTIVSNVVHVFITFTWLLLLLLLVEPIYIYISSVNHQQNETFL